MTFSCRILIGYVAGIAAKLLNESYIAAISAKYSVLFFYVLNFVTVVLDLCVYIRNRRLDNARSK